MNKLSVEGFPGNGTMRERELFLLRYAVRAPSTHNSQPWKFALFDDRIEIHLDTSRRLPMADADGRDAFISLGACLEHLIIAARYFGMYEDCVVTAGFGEGAVAAVRVHPPQTKNDSLLPIMKAISERFNARGPFLSKRIPTEIENALRELALEEGISLKLIDGKNKEAYAAMTAEGMRKVHSDSSFRTELSEWIEHNYSSRKDGIPGYTMLAPGPFSLILPWMIKTFDLGSILAKLNTKSILSSSYAAVLVSGEESPSAWLAVGRSFERISLFLATHDIRTSIYVATIEVPELREKLGAMIDANGRFPQFAFTLGYPKITLRQSPRFSPEERLIN